MTTKTISNTIITTGYSLSSAYDVLSITSTGTIDGVAGGAASGGTPGGRGGAGLTVSHAATIFNAGVILGGEGGIDSSGTSSGGSGGNGVLFNHGSFTNMSSITGGAGGAGGTGGAGGYGVRIQGGLANFGTVTGGVGGTGAGQGRGGRGGSGVRLTGSLTNDGNIMGAVGGDPAAPNETGAGVAIWTRGTIVNQADGVISGKVGVQTYASGFQSATVTNYGTITGTLASVDFRYASESLIAEAGSTFVGVAMGGGGTLLVVSGTETVTSLGHVGTLSGAVSMTASEFGFYELGANTTSTLIGTNTLNVTNKSSHQVTQYLDNVGTMTVSGTVDGMGDIRNYGTTTIEAGAVLNVAHWRQEVGLTNVDESLVYKGAFDMETGAVDVATGDKLTLTGAATLDGTLKGAGAVSVTNATAGSLTVAETGGFSVAGTVTAEGVVTIGDSSGGAASLTIEKTGVWDITNFGFGGTRGSKITVYGQMVERDSTFGGYDGVATYDYGLIEATTSFLQLEAVMFGTGLLKIDAGAKLTADTTVGDKLTTIFNGSSATLALAKPKTFAATISGFAATDVIDLIRIVATGTSVNASDQLVIVNGTTTVASLQLTGNYSGETFNLAGDGEHGTDITLAGAPGAPPPHAAASSPHAFAAAMASIGATRGSTLATTVHVDAWRPTLLAPMARLA